MGLFATIIEILGVIAFSISGAMIAIRRKTDLFGVILLAIITAHGGGLTRDVIFSFSPPAIFGLKSYILICVVVAVIVFLFARKFSHTYLENELKIEHINDVFDALGLGVFAVIAGSCTNASGNGLPYTRHSHSLESGLDPQGPTIIISTFLKQFVSDFLENQLIRNTRLKFDPNVTILTVTTGLFLVFTLNFDLFAYSFFVCNLWNAEFNLNTKIVFQLC